MATLLFLILRLTHVVNLPDPQSDLVVFCQLMALDTIAAAVVFHALVTRKNKKA